MMLPEADCVVVQVYGSVQAGSYRFSVMLAGQTADQAAQSLFQNSTEGPSVAITVAPPNPTTGQVVAFKFVSEAAAYFQCRWVNVTASSPDDYATCNSPAYGSALPCLPALPCPACPALPHLQPALHLPLFICRPPWCIHLSVLPFCCYLLPELVSVMPVRRHGHIPRSHIMLQILSLFLPSHPCCWQTWPWHICRYALIYPCAPYINDSAEHS